jgi:thiosulfate/3-mercaptopyruvate sulfurtransferase
LHAWAGAGGGLSSGAFAAATDQPPIQLAINSQPIAEIADVLAAIDEPAQVILDVRSRDEYLGLRSGSARAGHIPGAVNLDWELLKDPGRHWRLRENLREDFATLGIDQSTRVITHCQTHHRSGLSYLVGRLLGIDIRAYHGSWAEWGNDPDLPIE